MDIGKPINSDFEQTAYTENLHAISEGVYPTLDNGIDLYTDGSYQIEISWLVSILSTVSHLPIFDFTFLTTVQVIAVKDVEKDFDIAKLLVYDSCNDFMQKLKSISNTTPLLEPKFDEIAGRIIEKLVFANLYQ
jgi:hypothetical protein